jgi:hypothetical protein
MAQYELPYNENPLKWSAGLAVERSERSPLQWTAIGPNHPACVKDTLKYLRRKDLIRTRKFWPLAFLPQFLAEKMMTYFFHFSGGQNYADVTLNVFKRQGGLCLTSFEMFNHGSASVHQLPWMANIGGVGVWSQSGSDKLSFAIPRGRSFTNTHSPFVSQKGGLLVACYASPPILSPPSTNGSRSIIGTIVGTDSRVFWPEGDGLFDETIHDDVLKICHCKNNKCNCESLNGRTIPGGQWWMGRRGDCMIGLMCSQKYVYFHFYFHACIYLHTNTYL